VKAVDQYRWMEDETPGLRTWVQAQHDLTMAQLSSLPSREDIRRRLEELLHTNAITGLTKAGNRYFFRHRLANQELSSLYYYDASHSAPQLLLDPNQLSAGRTIVLMDTHPSSDGRLIAYRLSSAGSSHMSLHVCTVDGKRVLPDVIPGDVNPVAHTWHTKNRVAWLPDNGGFFYTRCPHDAPAGETRFNHKLYLHQLGDDWREDYLIFGESLTREQTPYPLVSPDGRYLLVLVQDVSGTEPRSQLHLLGLEHPPYSWVPVVQGIDAFISAAAFHRETLYIQTDHEAPLGKIIAIKLTHIVGGEFTATTVIAAESYPLRSWATARDYLFVETIENVSSRLRVYDPAGKFVKQIELPGTGSIDSLTASSDELLFSFSSFLMPKAVYRVDLETLEYRLFQEQPEAAFDADAFELEQVWFESRDQTRIPMFLVHRKGLERDGKNAVVIHGYGGFGVSLLPTFAPHVVPFLERGGIYAVVNARGGGELGEEWHRAGMRENKQNVFDDFIAAGEWLIAEGYTQSSRLGCFGWSNGGLSVNAVAVQRPDLWKAVVAGAPVTDLARFHTAHGGQHWVADYGSPEDPRDLDFLMQYSPYHTLPEKIEAPAILTVVPENDDRVAPWHSYKMHAAWLAANVSTNPILLREEKQAGHRGSPLASRTIARYTDIWTFFFWQLGLG
jgi:prolyl oligopeptidase